MPTNHDETLLERYQREADIDERMRLLAGVEIPHHPEPHTYRWSRLEEEAIKQYAAAAALNAWNKALDGAKGVCVDLMAPPSVGCIANANIYHDATEDCAAAIEALRETK